MVVKVIAEVDQLSCLVPELPSYKTHSFSLGEIQSVISIPPYTIDLQTERRQRGEELDRVYSTLWEQERALVGELQLTDCYDEYQAISAQLDIIRYQMTQILDQFDHGAEIMLSGNIGE